jgi:hypothetical protein
MDVAPFIENNKVYIPLRFALESLDMIVDWDGINKAVLITSNKKQNITPAETPAEYKELGTGEIPGELTGWVEANSRERGIYFKILNG